MGASLGLGMRVWGLCTGVGFRAVACSFLRAWGQG